MGDGESHQCCSQAFSESNDEFMSGKRWQECREQVCFDYVVIGSSFCAWAFTHRILSNNPEAKVLILECGEYRREHFEDHEPSEKRELTYSTKTFPWNITRKMQDEEYIKDLDGVNIFFGGQSAFWRGWCPQPTREDLDGWPDSVKNVVEKYFPEAVELLNVKSANTIGMNEHVNDNRVFGKLQNVLVERIQSCLPEVSHAMLAISPDKSRCERIQKTTVADPLLELLRKKKLEIKINCEVKKIVHENCNAVSLETSEGNVKLGNAKLILAMGVLPATTLMLNSFPPSSFKPLSGIGSRFTAHFRSSILARVPFCKDSRPWSVFHNLKDEIVGRFEVAAMHIPGTNPNQEGHFHIQLSAILDCTPRDDTKTTEHQYPDVLPAFLIKKETSSKDPPHLLLVCKIIGGLDYRNENNWFRLDSEVPSSEEIVRDNHAAATYNTTLQAVTNETDLQLWNTMEESTFEMLENAFAMGEDYPDDPCQLEFWHDPEEGWKRDRPPPDKIRRNRLVHPASTMWIGEYDESTPVDLDYRFRGVGNVYLTGGALWPVAGSLNPTCIMAALAMNLADKLLN